MKWTGKITARVTGRHIFTASSDDGIVVKIGGVVVINQWRSMAVHEGIQAGEVVMEAGKKYPIEVYYFEMTGRASCQLIWEGPGMSEEIIPKSQLFAPEAGLAVSELPLQAVFN